MTRVSDNFGLIVRAFFTLAGVRYMIVSMSAFYIYSTSKMALWKTSKYLVYYSESMKNISASTLKIRLFFVTLTLIFSTIIYEGTLNERIRSTLNLMGTDYWIIFINLLQKQIKREIKSLKRIT